MMGHKFEVWAWVRLHGGKDNKDYSYRLEYSGNSMEKALLKMCELRKAGVGCVKFEWRG